LIPGPSQIVFAFVNLISLHSEMESALLNLISLHSELKNAVTIPIVVADRDQVSNSQASPDISVRFHRKQIRGGRIDRFSSILHPKHPAQTVVAG
jgi:hypothetical protein